MSWLGSRPVAAGGLAAHGISGPLVKIRCRNGLKGPSPKRLNGWLALIPQLGKDREEKPPIWRKAACEDEAKNIILGMAEGPRQAKNEYTERGADFRSLEVARTVLNCVTMIPASRGSGSGVGRDERLDIWRRRSIRLRLNEVHRAIESVGIEI